jgi:toxic protein SymE
MAYNENEQKLLDDYKQTKEKLVQIENVLAGIQSDIPGKLLAKSVTNHQA